MGDIVALVDGESKQQMEPRAQLNKSGTQIEFQAGFQRRFRPAGIPKRLGRPPLKVPQIVRKNDPLVL